MPMPAAFKDRLLLPAIAAPMFLTSGPDLVAEVCKAGVIGTFPALNQRSTDGYRGWLDTIIGRLEEKPKAAPFGVNLIVHRSNPRLDADLAVTIDKKVPLVITSLGAKKEVVDAVHGYGGLVFHDVISMRHAEKAAAIAVDGLIAVCGGAGGHAGTLNPFAFLPELKAMFEGTIILAGAISTGRQVAAARLMGADLAYLGTRFIATEEALVVQGYKDMLVRSRAADILYTPGISGVAANFMRDSIRAAGLDPDDLPPPGELDLEHEARAWKTIWSAGQGVGAIHKVLKAADLCRQLLTEYQEAMRLAAADPFALEPA